MTYKHRNEVCVGEVSNERVRRLSVSGAPILELIALIKNPALLARCEADGKAVDLKDVNLLAPIPEPPRNIFCVGKNYAKHASEFASSGFDAGTSAAADAIPGYPIIFTKPAHCVIGPGERVWRAEGLTDSLDYEVELAVIIGSGGRGIAKADAMKHIFGYTIINDVTARDWQKRHKQWFLGKSFDTFCPMGPMAVTFDEVDAGNLEVKCWINGELRQEANTRDLIFDIPTLIETLSAGITLFPGDIIATGTPEGVGIGFNPPKFLKAGDVMTLEIQGLGQLQNEVG